MKFSLHLLSSSCFKACCGSRIELTQPGFSLHVGFVPRVTRAARLRLPSAPPPPATHLAVARARRWKSVRALGRQWRGLPPHIRSLPSSREVSFPISGCAPLTAQVDTGGQIRLSPDRIYRPLAGLHLRQRWQSRHRGGVLGMFL